MSLRSPLGRVRGLGSAKDGTRHWLWQRLTAIALIPLSLWFVAALVSMVSADYATAIAWVRSPFSSVLLLCFIAATFYHAQLGLQVVLEDYVHAEWLKVAALIALRFVIVLLGLAAVLAVLRIALGAS